MVRGGNGSPDTTAMTGLGRHLDYNKAEDNGIVLLTFTDEVCGLTSGSEHDVWRAVELAPEERVEAS